MIVRRFAFLSAVLVPAAVACSATVEPFPTPTPSPTPTTTSTQPNTPDPTPTPTVDPKPDAGPAKDAATTKDAADEKSIQGSAECTLYCDTLATKCTGQKCSSTQCNVPAGHCAASYKAYLKCQAETGSWYCTTGGYSVVHSCRKDTSLCN